MLKIKKRCSKYCPAATITWRSDIHACSFSELSSVRSSISAQQLRRECRGQGHEGITEMFDDHLEGSEGPKAGKDLGSDRGEEDDV